MRKIDLIYVGADSIMLGSIHLILNLLHLLVFKQKALKNKYSQIIFKSHPYLSTQIWDKKKEYNKKQRERRAPTGKEGSIKKLQIPTLPPKSRMSGVTCHFKMPFPIQPG